MVVQILLPLLMNAKDVDEAVEQLSKAKQQFVSPMLGVALAQPGY